MSSQLQADNRRFDIVNYTTSESFYVKSNEYFETGYQFQNPVVTTVMKSALF